MFSWIIFTGVMIFCVDLTGGMPLAGIFVLGSLLNRVRSYSSMYFRVKTNAGYCTDCEHYYTYDGSSYGPIGWSSWCSPYTETASIPYQATSVRLVCWAQAGETIFDLNWASMDTHHCYEVRGTTLNTWYTVEDCPASYTQPPTPNPTDQPTPSPTCNPTISPTLSPTTVSPTQFPSIPPTLMPTGTPSMDPSMGPSKSPSTEPSFHPSLSPTHFPTQNPSSSPSQSPSFVPTQGPTMHPSCDPTRVPTMAPTIFSMEPTSAPNIDLNLDDDDNGSDDGDDNADGDALISTTDGSDEDSDNDGNGNGDPIGSDDASGKKNHGNLFTEYGQALIYLCIIIGSSVLVGCIIHQFVKQRNKSRQKRTKSEMNESAKALEMMRGGDTQTGGGGETVVNVNDPFNTNSGEQGIVIDDTEDDEAMYSPVNNRQQSVATTTGGGENTSFVTPTAGGQSPPPVRKKNGKNPTLGRVASSSQADESRSSIIADDEDLYESAPRTTTTTQSLPSPSPPMARTTLKSVDSQEIMQTVGMIISPDLETPQ